MELIPAHVCMILTTERLSYCSTQCNGKNLQLMMVPVIWFDMVDHVRKVLPLSPLKIQYNKKFPEYLTWGRDSHEHV